MRKKIKNKKHLRIVIGINSLIATRWQAYSNHIQLFYRLGKDYPDIDFCLVNPSRMSIDRMRNMCAEVALDGEFDYVLFIDDDVIVPMYPKADWLRKLLAAKADIACGDVIIRGWSFQHMMFRYKDKKKTQLLALDNLPKGPKGVIPVDAVGFSLTLIKTSVFKKSGMQAPYFITGTHNTEDIYFCLKARQCDPKTTIVCDTRIECAHILWDEVISPQNRENFREYYEKQYPEVLAKEPNKRDRGKQYLTEIRNLK